MVATLRGAPTTARGRVRCAVAISNLQHVEEDDLTSTGILKTIEARKLIKFWKNKVQKPAAPQPTTSYGSTEEASNQSSCSSNSNPGMASPNWAFTFQIPWAAFPKNLLDACEAGKRPPKRLRLQMI